MDIPDLAWLAAGLSLAMTLAWVTRLLTGASGWIDTIWSLATGAGGIAATLLAADGNLSLRHGVVIALAAIWSLRLGSHIGRRTRGSGEDPRYAKLIAGWGGSYRWRLWLFLQIQAAAALVLVLAVYLAAANPAGFPRALDIAGVLIAFAAIGGEAMADAQLARFRRSAVAKSGVCEIGLWRYSRHPNYFFEWLFWCGWPLLAIDIGFAWGWLSLLAPAMTYWLLVHVSGIPPLEEHMLRTRGERFRALQARVNMFFPGPRRYARVRKRST